MSEEIKELSVEEKASNASFQMGVIGGSNIAGVNDVESLSILLDEVGKHRDALLDYASKLSKGTDKDKENAKSYIQIDSFGSTLSKRIQDKIKELEK